MKLKLTNFGCHRQKTVKFNDVGMSLLSGESGRGKTTILRAINYVLFGIGKKLTSFEAGACSVELHWDVNGHDVRAKRSSRPNVLNVTIDDESYTDSSAQSALESALGISQSMYDLAGYCAQGVNSSLLSTPPSEQLQFLLSLANIGSAEERKDKLKKKTDETLRHLESLKTMKQIKEETLEEPPSGTEPPIEPLSADELSERADKVQRHIAKLNMTAKIDKKKLDEITQLLADKAETIKQKEQLETELAVLTHEMESDDTDEQDSLEETLSNLMTQRDSQHKLAMLKERLDDVQAQITSYFDEQRKKIKSLSGSVLSDEVKEEYNEQLEQAAFDDDDIDDALEEFIEAAPNVSLLTGKTYLTPDDLSEETVRRAVLEMYGDIDDVVKKTTNKCPCCENYMISVDGHFEHADKLDMTRDDIQRYHTIHMTLGMYFEAATSLKIDRAALTTAIEMSEKNKAEIARLKGEISSGIPPPSLAERRAKIKSEMEKLASDVSASDTLDADIEETRHKISESISRKRANARREQRIAEIQDMLSETSIDVEPKQKDMLSAKYTNTVEEIAKLEAQRAEFHDRIKKVTLRNSYMEKIRNHDRQKKEIDRLTIEINAYADKLENLKKLGETFRDAELKTLERTVGTLNHRAETYLSQMFDEPIDIRFQTSKELKSGKEKPQISVTVSYRGCQYDTVDQLSGGERQRANLAFLLAACEMVNSPILILDECLNSLDADTHFSILDTIKNFAEDRIVLVVSHEAIEGKFDSVIEV